MASKKTAPAKTGVTNTLKIAAEKDKSESRQFAEVSLSSITLNAVTARKFSQYSMGEIDITESIKVVKDKAFKVNAGDTTALEATLTAQATALDTIFNELARRAAANMGEYIHTTEIYMRLALKAQAQCARTIEVIAAMKNPPVIFAKQANIAQGNQQVNNGNLNATIPAHAGKTVNQTNELLEAQHNDEWLDNGKTETTSGTNRAMATVDAQHGSKNARR